MNGSPLSQIEISVFDKVLTQQDLTAVFHRTYTFTNSSDTQISIEKTRIEEFDVPVKDFRLINASVEVQISLSSQEGITQALWSFETQVLEPDDSIIIEFSFRRDFLKVEPPLTANFEYISTERVIYSCEIASEFPSLFKLSDYAASPAPMNSTEQSCSVTDDGKLKIAPRRISRNKGGKFSLQIISNPPEVETLPLLKILANEAKQIGVSIADLTVIIVPHLLTDFLSLIDALEIIGLKPEQTFIVGIPYSLKEHVVIRLLHRGYSSIWSPPKYPFTEIIDKVIEAASENAKKNGVKILIIEDGGYIVPRLHTHYPHLIPSVIGAVEQTANGIWAYRYDIPETEKQIATMNVAECELKKRRESPHIGDAVFRNVSSLLEREKMSIRDKQVLVVGFGSTGTEVAKVFKNNGAIVTIFDAEEDQRKKEEKEKKARDLGFEVGETLEVAIKGKNLVIGCTGESPIEINALLRADHQTRFVNASSKRLEVNHQDLHNITTRVEPIAEFIDRYHLMNNNWITLLADGFPVNFHGNSESVPDIELQFIYGLLFNSAVYVVQNSDLPVGIVDVPDEMQKKIENLHDSLLRRAFSG